VKHQIDVYVCHSCVYIETVSSSIYIYHSSVNGSSMNGLDTNLLCFHIYYIVVLLLNRKGSNSNVMLA